MKKLDLYIAASTKNFLKKQDAVRVWEIGNRAAFERKSKAHLATLNFNPRFTKIMQFGDATVWLVDGEKIRNTVDIDFTIGGHGYRYLYIPTSEIWVEREMKESERWPTIMHEYTERRLMQKGMTYDAHDYASIIETGIRRGDAVVLPVGTHHQNTGYTCGPSALKIVLDYLGNEHTEKKLAKLSKATPNKGTDPKDLVAAAQSLGYKVIWKQHWTADEVKDEIKKGRPMIANFQLKHEPDEGHYAVIIGFTNKDEFVLSDPSNAVPKGYRTIPAAKFIELWYELEDKTEKEGIVIYAE